MLTLKTAPPTAEMRKERKYLWRLSLVVLFFQCSGFLSLLLQWITSSWLASIPWLACVMFCGQPTSWTDRILFRTLDIWRAFLWSGCICKRKQQGTVLCYRKVSKQSQFCFLFFFTFHHEVKDIHVYDVASTQPAVSSWQLPQVTYIHRCLCRCVIKYFSSRGQQPYLESVWFGLKKANKETVRTALWIEMSLVLLRQG